MCTRRHVYLFDTTRLGTGVPTGAVLSTLGVRIKMHRSPTTSTLSPTPGPLPSTR